MIIILGQTDGMAGRKIGAVDIHVGLRVRAARLVCHMSQARLGDAVGVTFRQIQKYENGVNRIGTGRLHAIAKLLRVPVTYFFEGADNNLSKPARESGMGVVTEALSTTEGVRIAAALSRIHNRDIRRRLASLLEAIVERESQEIRPQNGA
jgi:transcriptional regulator with XRE-family HTH domain